jgi:hypothetical protein
MNYAAPWWLVTALILSALAIIGAVLRERFAAADGVFKVTVGPPISSQKR